MQLDLAPLLYIGVGYLLALLTIYISAICTQRVAKGRSLAPKLPRRSKQSVGDPETGYQSRYAEYNV